MTRVRIIVTIALLFAGMVVALATPQLTTSAYAQQAQDVPTDQWNDRFSNSSWTKCAINADNSVWCWSNQPVPNTSRGQTPIYNTTPQKIEGVTAKAISAGTDKICAIAMDNELWCWAGTTSEENANNPTEAIPKKVGMQAKKVVLKHDRVHVIDSNNGLWEWEWSWNTEATIDQDIQSRKKTTDIKMKDVHSDFYATCAIDLENKVWCWDKGKLGVASKVTPQRSETPVLISGITANAKKVIANNRFACVLNTTGEVQCWGDNSDGQLGSETPGSTSTPTKVDKLPKDIADITLNQSSVCALDRSGSSWCWGNSRPDFGNAPDINYPEVPTKTNMPTARVLQIDERICVVDTAGYVWCTKDPYSYVSDNPHPNYTFEKKENIRLTGTFKA